MVASSSPKEAGIVATLGPEVVITESPDRIGTLKSVGKDREFVVQSIKKVKTVNPDILVFCGAGVSSGRDIADLVKLGVEGTGASEQSLRQKTL
jgi:triosephosphate isomerase